MGMATRTIRMSARRTAADIPFDFDLATQTFKIRSGELVPLPERFRQRGFEGLHVLVPVDLEGLSKQEVEWIVQKRGGSVVGAEGPVDVIVLPDRIDFCPHSSRGRNRLAERWIRRGAKVLWERNFGRPGVLPVGHPEGDWRDGRRQRRLPHPGGYKSNHLDDIMNTCRLHGSSTLPWAHPPR